MYDIKEIVKNLIINHETNDPFIICEALNIKVMHRDLKNARGMFINGYRKPLIIINSLIDFVHQRQICAHELGHCILHKNINTLFCDNYTFVSTDRIETEADVFAAELLINDTDLYSYAGYTQETVANIFGVQESLVEYKLKKHINKEAFR